MLTRGTNAVDPAEDPIEIQAAPDAENQAESQGETSAINLEEIQAAIQEDVVESGEENPDEDASNDVTEGEKERPVVTRSGRTVVRPSRFAAVTKVATREWQQECDKTLLFPRLRPRLGES